MLPAKTITITLETDVLGTTILVEPPYTVLGYFLSQESDKTSVTKLKAGDVVLSIQRSGASKDIYSTGYVETNFFEDTFPLVLEKNEDFPGFVLVNYVEYNRQASSSYDLPSGFTFGESLIAYFLLVLIIGSVFGFLVNKFIYHK